MPGYLLRPDATGAARPTLVMTNGSDGPLSSSGPRAGSDAHDRGWNVFVYDGPNGGMLFEHNVSFRPDWEAVLTPVVDALVAWPDVDANALTAYAISQGGYWLPRGPGLRAPVRRRGGRRGRRDVSTSWMAYLPPEMVQLLDSGQKDLFNRYMQQGPSTPASSAPSRSALVPMGWTTRTSLHRGAGSTNCATWPGKIHTC